MIIKIETKDDYVAKSGTAGHVYGYDGGKVYCCGKSDTLEVDKTYEITVKEFGNKSFIQTVKEQDNLSLDGIPQADESDNKTKIKEYIKTIKDTIHDLEDLL